MPTSLPGQVPPAPAGTLAGPVTPGVRAAGVADRPRLTATVRPDGAGELTINGVEHPCAAATRDQLLAGITARCVAVATTVSRPVRLRLTEGLRTTWLSVRPDGIVQPLDDDGTVDPTAGLAVLESWCRRCGTEQPITTTTCARCGALEPHRVELVGVVVRDASWLESLDEHSEHSEHSEHGPSAATGPADDVAGRRRPTLLLTFSGQEPVLLHENAALGRNPGAIAGRRQVQVVSPSVMVSKTHLLVDVDDAGRVLVTDYRSANGTSIRAEPPVHLEPGRPFEIASGTALLLGDVTCTVQVVPGE